MTAPQTPAGRVTPVPGQLVTTSSPPGHELRAQTPAVVSVEAAPSPLLDGAAGEAGAARGLSEPTWADPQCQHSWPTGWQPTAGHHECDLTPDHDVEHQCACGATAGDA